MIQSAGADARNRRAIHLAGGIVEHETHTHVVDVAGVSTKELHANLQRALAPVNVFEVTTVCHLIVGSV